MKNELYDPLIKHIAEHGYKLTDGTFLRDSAVDRLHVVMTHLYHPERYFVYLLDKSLLIRKYDDFTGTKECRRSL